MNMKFKIGDRVKVKDCKLDHIFFVKGIGGDVYWLETYRDGVPVASYYRRQDEIYLAVPTCPVCEKEVEVENNKIKEHQHNNELCYGSYTPI